ncbi:MAG: MarR family transcriptional regulator [Lysobacterales bacterium]|jgi:DNA-binding MarR family transcriptional regulator
MNQQTSAESTLGFLIYDISRLMRSSIMERLGDLGLTEAQWRAIAHLTRMEGCRQTDLAQSLEIRPITLGRVVDRLEASGFVERRQHPTDRRAVTLHLTPSAGPLVNRLRELGQELREYALQGIDVADRQHLNRMLVRMRDNLSREGGTMPQEITGKKAP